MKNISESRRHGLTTGRLVLVACAVGSVALSFAPIARAETGLVLTASAEAWYQPNPSCAAATKCLSTAALPAQPPVTSPFPARTLHVGLSGGQETARTYLALPFSAVTASITAASLSVPLDTAPVDGSSSPTTAKLQVCLTSGTLVAMDGSFNPPPRADCATSAPVKYVATPTPHLQADLTPLLGGLSGATGLVLLPDATRAAGTDSWRIVFSAHDRTDAAKTSPAVVTVAVPEASKETTVIAQDEAVSDQPAPRVPDYLPARGTSFTSPLAVPERGIVPMVVGPPVLAPVGIHTVSVTLPQTITLGYAYPAVWLLPLAFLLIIPMTARALSKDLTPMAR